MDRTHTDDDRRAVTDLMDANRHIDLARGRLESALRIGLPTADAQRGAEAALSALLGTRRSVVAIKAATR